VQMAAAALVFMCYDDKEMFGAPQANQFCQWKTGIHQFKIGLTRRGSQRRSAVRCYALHQFPGVAALIVRPQSHPTCTFENSIEKAA